MDRAPSAVRGGRRPKIVDRLERRPDERRRLEVAQGWSGPSPSRFNGREPLTSYTFLNKAGKQCAAVDAWQVVAEREPEWTASDQRLALALYGYRHERLCKCGCGQLAADTQRDVDEPHPPSWDIHQIRCTARASLEVVKRDATWSARPKSEWPKGYAPGQMKDDDGLLFWATRVTDLETPAPERSERT